MSDLKKLCNLTRIVFLPKNITNIASKNWKKKLGTKFKLYQTVYDSSSSQPVE